MLVIAVKPLHEGYIVDKASRSKAANCFAIDGYTTLGGQGVMLGSTRRLPARIPAASHLRIMLCTIVDFPLPSVPERT